MAFAIACASRDQRVLFVDSLPAGELADPETAEYIQAMTGDLGSINRDLEVAHTARNPCRPKGNDRESNHFSADGSGNGRRCAWLGVRVMFSDYRHVDDAITERRWNLSAPFRWAPTRPTVNGGAGACRLVECPLKRRLWT